MLSFTADGATLSLCHLTCPHLCSGLAKSIFTVDFALHDNAIRGVEFPPAFVVNLQKFPCKHLHLVPQRHQFPHIDQKFVYSLGFTGVLE